MFIFSFNGCLKKAEKLAHKEAMRIHKTKVLKKMEQPNWEVRISRDDWQPNKLSYYIVATNPKSFFETGREEEVRMTSEFSLKKFPAQWHEAILQAYEETFEEELLGYRMLGGLTVLKSED